MSVTTTPLLFLALGAAAGRGAPLRPDARGRVSGAAVAGLGLAAAAVLVLGDVRLEQARLDFGLDDGRAADELLRPWPEPATVLARMHGFAAISDPAERGQAIRWRREAVRRDRRDPALHTLLGDELNRGGHPAAARREYERALALNPYSTTALVRLADAASGAGDVEVARHYLERAMDVRATPSIQRRLGRLRQQP
jgi:tetratricopeptide (TPR) repeat protein